MCYNLFKGFMGKVLVEKILRDCERVGKIYILVREKKGVSPQERYDSYVNHIGEFLCFLIRFFSPSPFTVFEKIRNEKPQILSKVKVIKGDVTMDNLGLDAFDELELIKNVNIVFHMAANVRFDLPLKMATNFNVHGTYLVLQLAEKMQRLEVFTHVSTSYCHCNEEFLDECYYPATENPYGVMEMTKFLSEDVLDLITPKLLGKLPNTYSYTKGLTEDLVHSFRNKFSIVIVRPSIVTASWKEPIPGFVEGVNGPTGLMIAAGKGVVRTMYCFEENLCEAIPVDITINCIIALPYKKSLIENQKEVLFVNVCDAGTLGTTWGQSLKISKQLFYDYPMSISLWYPNGSMKRNYFHHWLSVIFLHYLPAYFVDFMLFITGNKTFLVNIQRRLSHGLKVLEYYTTRTWNFRNNNFKQIYADLNDVDKKKFNFNLADVELKEYLLNYILGIRTFILKEKPEDLPKARANLKR